LEALGLNERQLAQLPKGAAEKVGLAWWVRQRATEPLRSVSGRLDIGHSSRVAHAVCRMRRRPDRKLEKLRRKLAQALNNGTQSEMAGKCHNSRTAPSADPSAHRGGRG
jgi:hypothetical protein